MATYYEKLKENNDIGKMMEQITDTSKWELTKFQKNIIESISVPDLCADISKDILLSMKFLLTVSFRSYCRFISIDDQYSSDELYDTTLFAWIKTILDFCRHSLDYIIATREPDVNIKRAFAQYLIKGAAVNAFEAIQHSDIFTSPNISFKSTSLSYLAVNNDGFIENIFANDYIMGHKSLPSLGTFYNVSDITELRVKESGIIRNDDVSKKLKIITPWEGLLPVIQKYWELKLPSLSRFILTQLHENYIQLTLNQVVKASSLEEGDIDEEKTIIIQDETIPIQNIYNSLCVNTWNHLIENNNLIRLCNVHKERDDYKSLKLFSLQGKMEFIEIFAEYISSNVNNLKKHKLSN
ncbi:hypothetical protein INT48_002676 [Thamnidium elegans]|uniref:Uncharacterized protein n=1 Tax=Thamnidium elegans TaxID=101142 RepID=A0A8H7SZ71_9FUNG|nr:hypothetical protein INT48_002676 [Thamnidium elegans]